MASYEQFARIYDHALNVFPYEAWFEYLNRLFKRYAVEPKSILDLGCGTGSMSIRLAKAGYEPVAVDLSEDMLMIAREKTLEEGQEVLYLCQDMTELDLFGTIDAAFAFGDSMNYLLSYEELVETFRRVNMFLEPEGLFIFDMNTAYKFKEVLGNNTYAETEEDFAYIWENYFYDEEEINEYKVTIFIEEEDGTYERSEEIHHERAYSLDMVIRAIEASGLELLECFHDQTFEPIKPETERMYFVTREKGKKEQPK